MITTGVISIYVAIVLSLLNLFHRSMRQALLSIGIGLIGFALIAIALTL